MAASAIDEAVRNCVAVGADPRRIAILDNFCWGDCERPETLGSLVRAALACHDLSLVLETPFISGKDSLNNEFSYVDSSGSLPLAGRAGEGVEAGTRFRHPLYVPKTSFFKFNESAGWDCSAAISVGTGGRSSTSGLAERSR
jgi:hypothetical protein